MGRGTGSEEEEDYNYKNISSFNTKVSDYTQELRSSPLQKFACFSAHILIHRKKKIDFFALYSKRVFAKKY